MEARTISVDLGQRTYPVYLGSRTLATLGARCRDHQLPRSLAVVADWNTARVALKRARASLESAGFSVLPVVMPPGERQKSLARAGAVHSKMLHQRLGRKAGVIALGGGVVGDVAGFVASTYRRGLPFVQCPTTLLSQVDSSIGGKNGVNHPLSKNAIGTFHQPVFVLTDVELLRTLPKREIIAGLGEILKYPVVSDPTLLDAVEERVDRLLAADAETILEIAARCLTIKAALVSQDERELLTDRGRVFLNVGHTIGHALETLSRYRLRHGEAVLLGILAEGHIAAATQGFARADLDRLVHVYRRLGKKYSIRSISDRAIVRAIYEKGEPRFVLPRAMGSVVVVKDVPAECLLEGLRFLRSL